MLVDRSSVDTIARAAAELLRTIPHAVIATADTESQPWAVPVHQVTLTDGRMTWRSDKAARHSQNIAENKKMSVTLFRVDEVGEVSLFLEGTVSTVEAHDDLASIITARYGDLLGTPTIGEFQGEANYRMYAFTITGAWLNDDRHEKFTVDVPTLISYLTKMAEK